MFAKVSSRLFSAGAIGVGAALVLSACGNSAPVSGGAPSFELRIGLTSVTGTTQGNIGFGDEKKLLLEKLKPAGVTSIKYSLFQSGKDVTAALLSNAVDVAITGDNPGLTARGQGKATRLLALSGVNGDTWLLGKKGGPTTIQELQGKIVTAPQGTIRDRAAKSLIAAAGLTGKITVKDVPTPESLAALSAGSIDAVVVGGASAIELAAKGHPVIDKTSAHPGLSSTELNTTLETFLAAHPNFAATWQDAIVAVNKSIHEHAEEYYAYSAKKEDVSVEVAKQAEPLTRFNTEALPKDGLEQLKSAYDFLRADGTIEKPFEFDTWIVRP